ncbi:MAG: hypothetical protein M1820_008509 [Bogoriella megaspora]|nr:MAG: hypothetical protein M1820_008509 [Bogoriella megaspora]
MTHTLNSILLVGSTGKFGNLVTTELIAKRHQFKRIAVFNNTSRPTNEEKQTALDGFKKSGIEIVSAPDYSSSKVYEGFDCVISLLGNHGLFRQPEIFEAAIQAGVRHFYPSEYGADLLVGQNWTQRYYRYKVLTREYLEAKGKELPDLEWTYFTIGRLTEWAVLDHFGVNNKEATAQIYGKKEGLQSLLAEADCARYLVESLKDPVPDLGEPTKSTKGRQRTYRVSGANISWQELFRIVEKIRGLTYQVTYLDVEEASKEEADALKEEDIEKELAASHKLIQGREGTLLPQPWDNGRFPDIKPMGIEVALGKAYSSAYYKAVYGIP